MLPLSKHSESEKKTEPKRRRKEEEEKKGGGEHTQKQCILCAIGFHCLDLCQSGEWCGSFL